MTSNRRGVMPVSENRSRRRRRTLCEQIIIIINVPEDEESADHSNGAASPLTNGPRMAVDRKPFYQLPIKTPCYRLDMYFSNPLQLGRIMRKVLFSPFGIIHIGIFVLRVPQKIASHFVENFKSF